MSLCFLPGSANCTLRAVQKKSLPKHINMGSRFEDLAATNPFPKTERDLEIPFERYLFFRLQLQREKEKLAIPYVWDRSAVSVLAGSRAPRVTHARAVRPESVRWKLC